jgi:hypothetical protein
VNLEIQVVELYLRRNSKKKPHFERMSCDRIPEIFKRYNSRGRRDIKKIL